MSSLANVAILAVLTLTFLAEEMIVWQPIMNQNELAAATFGDYAGFNCELIDGVLHHNGSNCNLNATSCHCGFEDELPMQMMFTTLFIIPISITTIPFGYLADHRYRSLGLAGAVFLMGLAQFFIPSSGSYGVLATLRVISGAAMGAVHPICGAIITTTFFENNSKAMGVFNWAIYAGYALTILLSEITKNCFWWSYYTLGIISTVCSIALVLIHRRSQVPLKEADPDEMKQLDEVESGLSMSYMNTFKELLSVAMRVDTILIYVGGLLRHTEGYTFGINQIPYFTNEKGIENAAQYIFWCPIIAGISGSFMGGLITDYLKKKASFSGPRGGLLVLFISQFLGAPMFALVLSIDPPYCFYLLYVAYFLVEMWFGIFLVTFAGLFPSNLRGQALGYTLFSLRLIAGNLPVLIAPLKSHFSYHYAMMMMVPGLQFLSACFFLVAFCFLRKPETSSTS